MTEYITRSGPDGYHIEINTNNPQLYQLVQAAARMVMDAEEKEKTVEI